MTILLIREHKVKAYVTRMFSGRAAAKHILIWVIILVAGVFVSEIYSLATGTDVFQKAYPSAISLLTGFGYLYVTGFVEEIAWRGFLLERVSAKKKVLAILFVGIAWMVWHMPMWIIRNSLGIEQITCLCIWTMLVSFVLCITYYQCRNVLIMALLHATFNIFYLAPMQYNIAVLVIIGAIYTLFIQRKCKRPEE